MVKGKLEPEIQNGTIQDESKYIMLLRTFHCEMIRHLFDTLDNNLTDIYLRFTEEGVKIYELDAVGTVFIEMNLWRDDIRLDGVYFCTEPRSAGVNMSRINRIIKTLTKNDTVEFFIERPDPSVSANEIVSEKLGIRIYTPQHNTSSQYIIKMITLNRSGGDIGEKVQAISSQIEYTRSKKLVSQFFTQTMKSMSTISSKIDILVTKDEIKFYTEDKTTKRETTVTVPDTQETNRDNNLEIVHSRFNLRILSLVSKSGNLSPTVTLYFANEQPMAIKYNIANLGVIKFVVSSMPIRKEIDIGDSDSD